MKNKSLRVKLFITFQKIAMLVAGIFIILILANIFLTVFSFKSLELMNYINNISVKQFLVGAVLVCITFFAIAWSIATKYLDDNRYEFHKNFFLWIYGSGPNDYKEIPYKYIQGVRLDRKNDHVIAGTANVVFLLDYEDTRIESTIFKWIDYNEAQVIKAEIEGRINKKM